MKVEKYLLALFFLALISRSNSQEIGGHPRGIKWKSIETDTLRLIYPAGMDRQAFKVADLIHYGAKYNSKAVGGRVPKLSLIFQNQNVRPNGFVALMPFRSEFATTPPQDLQMVGSNDWLTVLGIHEYRHALQYYNQRRGVVRGLYWLTGETGWMIGSNLLFPPWYFEGDATYTETRLTNSGRGRTPSFYAPLWSLAEEGKRYSYTKLRNGSYKDLLPDHYAYGYLMCSYVSSKFGEESFVDITKKTTRLNGLLFPFSASMKKVTGTRPAALYAKAYSGMADEWKEQKLQYKVAEGAAITERLAREYRSYKSPVFIDSTRVVSIYSRLNEIKKMVEIDIRTGKRKELFPLGVMSNDRLQAAAGMVVWAEVEPDLRWSNRSFSVIKLYQESNGQVKTIGGKGKLFSPAISPDGEKIVAVSISENQLYEMVILSASTGKELARIPNKGGLNIYTPTWSTNGSRVAFVGGKNGELSLFEQAVDGGEQQLLIPFTTNIIANPSYGGDQIFFEASFGGRDNIYALNLNDRTVSQLTRAVIGGHHPSVYGRNLVYSSYSISGDMIHLLHNPSALQKMEKMVELRANTLPGSGAAINAGGYDITDSLATRSWKTRDYAPWAHLINVHSWGFVADRSYIGGMFSSGDVLSKLMVSASWMYSNRENSNLISGELLYGGWFPFVGLSFSQIFNRNPFPIFVDYYKYDEQVVSTSVKVPFNLSKGAYLTHIQVDGSYKYHTLRWKSPTVEKRQLHSYTLGLSYSNLRFMALQQINPRWGQVVRVKYMNAFAGGIKKELFRGNAKLFLPGFGKSHSLMVSGSLGWETNTSLYYFYDTTSISRGYLAFPFSRYKMATASYSMPVAYPDWGLNGWFFLKRVRVSGFYDYTRAKNDFGAKAWSNYASAGVEVIFDTSLLNLVEIPFGFRQSFLFNSDPRNRKNAYFEIFVNFAKF